MRRVCALLRAVNVGGQGRVVMSELRALLADRGSPPMCWRTIMPNWRR
ncbi:DUF1697 domain-containing protein [Phenylobacterium sp.]